MTFPTTEEILAKLPKLGTKAADLTEEHKMYLALAAGARVTAERRAGIWMLRTRDLLGFFDAPDGRIGVAVKAAPQSGQPASG